MTVSESMVCAAVKEHDKTVYLKVFGCQMNVYDSDRVLDLLTDAGFSKVDEIDMADVVLFMTCHIREKAAEKLYAEIGRVVALRKSMREHRRGMKIGVLGCVAQAEGEEVFRCHPEVDFVAGPQAYHGIVDIVTSIKDTTSSREKNKQLYLDFDVQAKFDCLDSQVVAPKSPSRKVAGAVSSFLTIQEGCDKFCAFCVVPYTRGPEYSRAPSKLRDEAEVMVARGVREITLLGQNVNAYSNVHDGEECSLAGVIRLLSCIEGLDRIRYTTSHPRNMSVDLMREHAENSKLMPYLHLPVQSGSDRILKSMNRGHTVREYLEVIEKVRSFCPDIAISGDFIVGFPGEEEEDFCATIDIVKAVEFAHSYSFKFSVRPGTSAERLPGHISNEVMSERLHRLQEVLSRSQIDYNTKFIGSVQQVFFDKHIKEKSMLTGRTPYNQLVSVPDSESYIGEMHNIKIYDCVGGRLSGNITNV